MNGYGEYNLRVVASDGEIEAAATLRLIVTAEALRPAVLIDITPSFPATLGQTVALQVISTGITDLQSVALSIDGKVQVLDRLGRVRFTPGRTGHFAIAATATDVDGQVGTATADLRVRDLADQASPEVRLELPIEGATISAPIEVRGAIADSNLDQFSIDLAPTGVGPIIHLANGLAATNGLLATLDPSRLANGAYVLRLNAVDMAGRVSTLTRVIEVNSATKPAAYSQAVTDLTAALGGVNVPVRRFYSSVNAAMNGSFGFGWTMAAADLDLGTNLPGVKGSTFDASGSYRLGTRLYANLPDGRRVGFTFTPTKSALGAATIYHPAWTADPGIDYQLATAEAALELVEGAFFELETGVPYNIETGRFDGFDLSLTAGDGTLYQYEIAQGLREIVAPTGARLLWTDSGVIAPDGARISFSRDGDGRVTEVTGPDGIQLLYRYNGRGELEAVINANSGERTLFSYDTAGTHRLTTVVAPSAAESRAVRYDDAGVVAGVDSIKGNLGPLSGLLGKPVVGALAAGQTDRFVISLTDFEGLTPQAGRVTLGVLVRATGVFNPGAPILRGAVAGQSITVAGQSAALFTVSRGGSYVVEVAGVDAVTAGSYNVEIYVAGDVNADGRVDGVDEEAFERAVGSRTGQPNYLAGADADRNGVINDADRVYVRGNFGFAVNRAPIITSTSVRTHVDLPVTVDLSALVSDPEGQGIFAVLGAAQRGAVRLNPGGRSVTFTPETGFAGDASFVVSADDGYLRSTAATITVNVSNAPVETIYIRPRPLRLEPGDVINLEVRVDFTDEKNVAVPANYVRFVTGEEKIATVNASGLVRGIARGVTTLSVVRGDVRAITALAVGRPDQPTEIVATVLGLDVFPNSVALAPGGFRQLLVAVLGDQNVSSKASGTSCFSSNSKVATVGENGLVTAVAAGRAVISVLHGGGEATIDVLVEAGRAGTVTVAQAGAVVQAANGAQVFVAPGTFTTNQKVSITPLTAQELPFKVPGPFQVAGAFELGGFDNSATQPLQLAIPVGTGIPAGRKVYFFMAGSVPDEQGRPVPHWFQVESGIVGADGIARTASPPYPGVTGIGKYVVVDVDPKKVGELRTQVVPTFPSDDIVFVLSSIIDGVGLGVVVDLLKDVLLVLEGGPRPLNVIAIPAVGLPTITSTQVDVNSGITTTFTTSISRRPSPVDELRPFIRFARLQFNPNPEVVLEGERFVLPGGDLSDVRVEFKMPGADPVLVTPLSTSSATALQVVVPQSIVLGLSEISVRRVDPTVVNQGGFLGRGSALNRSDSVHLRTSAVYVFGAMIQNDQVAVFRQDVALPNEAPRSELAARIPVGVKSGATRPRSTVATHDRTRAYVSLNEARAVAIIDAQALQVVDARPETDEIDYIKLPDDSSPYWVDADFHNYFLYVSDEHKTRIYVIDIRPGSATYHQLVKTMEIAGPIDGQFDSGFRGIAVNADSTRLFVTAPAGGSNSVTRGRPGSVVVFNIDIRSPISPNFIGPTESPLIRWTLVGDVIPVSFEPYSVSGTDSPAHMVVANRRFDSRGVSFLRATNSDKLDAWRVTNLNLELDANPGQFSNADYDYFDVNNAAGVVVTSDFRYAFVTGFNRVVWGIPDSDPNMDPRQPAGGNVGIIEHPFTPEARLIAATRPTPGAFPDNLVLSSDDKLLYAAYRGSRALFVFNVEEMIKTIEAEIGRQTPEQRLAGIPERLARVPINDLNPAVEANANYRRISPLLSLDARFDVPPGAANGPIGVGGHLLGLSAQRAPFLELISPIGGAAVADLTPEFRWEVTGPAGVISRIYVSAFPEGEGLFPDDRGASVAGIPERFVFPFNDDINPARIVKGVKLVDEFSYVLPDSLELTAGQTYYWGVEVVSGPRKERASGSFKTTLPADKTPKTPFPSVTVITHGFDLIGVGQLNDTLNFFDAPLQQVAQIPHFIDFAEQILRSTDGGAILLYNRVTGGWQPLDQRYTIKPGKPIILIPDWFKESKITDTGFAEAAADAFFASLVALNNERGGQLFQSPFHFIGHDRGAVVNSEIIQRLGAYAEKNPSAKIPDIQMTTLDPRDQAQDSLRLTFLSDEKKGSWKFSVGIFIGERGRG